MITPHAIFFSQKNLTCGVREKTIIRKAHLLVSQNLRFRKTLSRVLRIFAHGKKKEPRRVQPFEYFSLCAHSQAA